MNVIQTKKHVHKLYKSIFKIVKQEFLKIINEIYQTIYDEAVEMGFDGDIRNLDEAWIDEFFDRYNPVTKYVFSNEIDRKESRLFEALVSNELERLKSYAYAERLITSQIEQYAIDLEDSIAKVVYEDTDVKKVMWNAEQDHKTCSDCAELDGVIFELKDAPPKLHYRCRCWLTPIKE
jgi:SPP1 gp7 family putative phage head morphogenesis protein